MTTDDYLRFTLMLRRGGTDERGQPLVSEAAVGLMRRNHLGGAVHAGYMAERPGYGYGLGMHESNQEMMANLRKRILADPAGFLALAQAPALAKYPLEGQLYKRDRFPDAPEALKPYLNRKSLSWCYTCDRLTPTLKPGLLDEARQALEAVAPLYRYVMEM